MCLQALAPIAQLGVEGIATLCMMATDCSHCCLMCMLLLQIRDTPMPEQYRDMQVSCQPELGLS